MMLRSLAVLLLPALFATPALAGEDDWLDDDDGDKKEEPKRDGEDDDVQKGDDEGELDQMKGATEKTDEDLLGGEEEAGGGGEGEDSEAIYRAMLASVKEEPPDEALILWEKYLEKYPKSLFRDRIERTMADLEDGMYERKGPPGGEGGDAKDREIDLAVPLQLETINPRQQAQAGFEWGLPNYINLFAAYDHPFRRDLALHVGVRNRYTGFRVEAGLRYAFVKSTRTQTIATGLLDVGFNTVPAYPVLRPQVAFGQKLGPVDLQAQAGVELDTRKLAGVRPIGGINVTYNAADSVKIFAEGAMYHQWLSSPKGTLPYRFDTGSFGLKFLPSSQSIDEGALEVSLGATVPMTSQFWMFHYGSIMAQVNYFFD